MPFEIAQQILSAGPLPKIKGPDSSGLLEAFDSSRLLEACDAGDFNQVRMLLSFGARPDDGDILMTAIRARHLNIVALLLANGADYSNQSPTSGFTALHYASVHGDLSIVRLLLLHVQQKGNTEATTATKTITSPVCPKDHQGRTPLFCASRCGHTDTVRLLLQHGADVYVTNRKSQTALHAAASHGHVDVVQLLLSEVTVTTTGGSTIPDGDDARHSYYCNLADEHGRTALELACRYSHMATIRYLLQHGADCNGGRGPHHAGTPLSQAIRRGRVAVAQLLLASGANVATDEGPQSPPLHMAIRQGRTDLIELLLQNHNAQTRTRILQQTDRRGQTALHRAVRCGHTAIIQLILDYLENDKGEDKTRESALMFAVRAGNWAVARALMEHGVKPSAEALLAAVKEQLWNMTRLLLDHGADSNALDRKGRTVLHVAVSRDIQVAKLLLDYGASPNIPDQPHGQTELHRAACSKEVSIIKMLFDYGADTRIRDRDGKMALHLACEQQDVGSILLIFQNMVGVGAITFK